MGDVQLLNGIAHYIISLRLVIVFMHIVPALASYSETSNNGLSERRTTSAQRTKSMPPIALPIEIVHLVVIPGHF